MSHGDHVSKLAPGFEVFAISPNASNAVVADIKRNFYGVQFHPEVHHTTNGLILFDNFLKIAGFNGDWTMKAYQEEMIHQIKNKVKKNKVICGISGGVDSTVTAVLLHKAIKKATNMHFVNHGFLRKMKKMKFWRCLKMTLKFH